jgi:hypothetical protein
MLRIRKILCKDSWAKEAWARIIGKNIMGKNHAQKYLSSVVRLLSSV